MAHMIFPKLEFPPLRQLEHFPDPIWQGDGPRPPSFENWRASRGFSQICANSSTLPSLVPPQRMIPPTSTPSGVKLTIVIRSASLLIKPDCQFTRVTSRALCCYPPR